MARKYLKPTLKTRFCRCRPLCGSIEQTGEKPNDGEGPDVKELFQDDELF